MHRLRCGVIYTNAFADYLSALGGDAAPSSKKILSVEYVRCSTGGAAGKAWWTIDWVPVHRAPEECRFLIGQIPVCLSRQSQRGLKHRCIDWRDGQVVIRS
jgi:hypothetical protein